MKNVLIIENSPCKLEPVLESAGAVKGTKDYTLSGIFTEFNKVNRNDRMYLAEKFLPYLDEMKARMINPGVVYGEFDHPDNFDISLARISHVITKADYVKEENLVRGEIKLLTTKYGKEARAIIDDGFPIFVSSRAAGVTEANGVVSLKKLFTYDAVADPGFGSAKMEMNNNLNESLGYSKNANFRIFDLSNDIKTNELFEMNNNDMVTKSQLVEYSKYLTGELEKLQAKLEGFATGKDAQPDFDKMQKMISDYENMQQVQEKLVGYVNYLSDHLKHVLIENKSLKDKQAKMIEHSDYLATELEESLKNTEMLAEHVYSNKEILETLNTDVKDLTDYSNYLGEHLGKTIEYAEYITENLVNTIEHADYLAEHLDAVIAFGDYIAENLDANIEMSNYLAEHVETTIEYAEYITENVSENIEYIDYIAENVDNMIGYNKYIAEKLNAKATKSLNENAEGEEAVEDTIMSPEEFAKAEAEKEVAEEPVKQEDPANLGEGPVATEEPEVISCTRDEEGNLIPAEVEKPEATEESPAETEEETVSGVEEVELDEVETEEEETEEETEETTMEEPALAGIVAGSTVKVDGTVETAKVVSVSEAGVVIEMTSTGEQVLKQANELVTLNSDGTETVTLSEEIDNLIEQAKKREASKDVDPHFFTFLSEEQKANFKALSDDDQEKIKIAVNESEGYFSQADVLKIMHKALEIETETIEEKLIKFMPEDVKPIWEQLDTKTKGGIFAQSKIHNLSNSELIEHFWRTRPQLKDNSKMLTEGKKEIASDIYDNSKLDENVIDMFKSKFDRLK